VAVGVGATVVDAVATAIGPRDGTLVAEIAVGVAVAVGDVMNGATAVGSMRTALGSRGRQAVPKKSHRMTIQAAR
jgi:hypothetical protein